MAEATQNRLECRAALVWDVPQLRAFDTPQATAFADSFRAGGRPEESTSTSEAGPLGIAARIVRLELQGQHARAAPLYEDLTRGKWQRALGTSLRAWAPSADVGARELDEAAAAARDLADEDVTPRVLSKLAAIAADRNLLGISGGFLEEAIALAPKPSRLANALSVARAQVTGEFVLFAHDPNLPADYLVDQPWIENVALESNRGQLEAMVAQRVKNPWSTTFRFGVTEIDHAVAADRQATWSGALWLRPTLRRQIGSQILLDSGASSGRLAYAVMMWVLGGGKDPGQVADFGEPRLDAEDVQRVISHLLSADQPSPSRQLVAAQVSLSLWDCLEQTEISDVFETLSPDKVAVIAAPPVCRLWAALAYRQPEGWSEAFEALSVRSRAAVTASMAPATISRLPDAAAASAWGALDEFPADDPRVEADPLLLRASLALRLGRDQESLEMSELSATQIVDLAHVAPELVATSDLQRAAASLAESLEVAAEKARAGTFGLGSSLEALMGQVILLLGSEGRKHVDALLRVIRAPWFPGEGRLSALNALAAIALELGISEDEAWAIRESPTEIPAVDFSAVNEEVLEAAKLLVLFDRLTPNDEAAVAALSRGNDGRARELAVNCAGLAYRSSGHQLMAQVPVAALFDPEPEVVKRGLQELQSGVAEELLPTVALRLTTLAGPYPRRVRQAAMNLARNLTEGAGSDARLEEVLAQGQADKSWMVRSAADGRDE